MLMDQVLPWFVAWIFCLETLHVYQPVLVLKSIEEEIPQSLKAIRPTN